MAIWTIDSRLKSLPRMTMLRARKRSSKRRGWIRSANAASSKSARPNVKQLRTLAQQGQLPLQLVDVAVTNSLTEFQRRALELAQKVDAFFVLNHDTLRDDQGNHVDVLTVGRWYLENIKKPEASHEDHFVLEGMLATANDSGYNQGYYAFEMAYDILEQGLNPSHMRTITPPRGP